MTARADMKYKRKYKDLKKKIREMEEVTVSARTEYPPPG
jgi:hypothetical protein